MGMRLLDHAPDIRRWITLAKLREALGIFEAQYGDINIGVGPVGNLIVWTPCDQPEHGPCEGMAVGYIDLSDETWETF